MGLDCGAKLVQGNKAIRPYGGKGTQGYNEVRFYDNKAIGWSYKAEAQARAKANPNPTATVENKDKAT